MIRERSKTPVIQHPQPLPIAGMICRRGRSGMQFSFSLGSRYEIRAIQRAKLRRMGMEDEKSLTMSASEVEMAEPNQAMSASHPASLDNDSDEITSIGDVVVK
ncbi:uncharacterized protein LOC122656735 [Telopea speciosissima]|uniref:uncharacterized protein LOC122656735 n=1 Tax=Telopea speciosissima TaxID=54955 RepID=UPI001CC5EBBF|nr:uncharacterized protein LOC122656735 [Telopea speciosissima]XP_043707304.1 uncharacterized protein LOC122656735 [Telopea speciosissima]